MRSGKILLFAVLMAILASSGFVQDAQAAKKGVTIINKTSQEVTVRFDGEKTYIISVSAGGKVTEKLDKDEYLVTYSVCGKEFNWELELDDDFTMKLYPCQARPTKIQVKSHLGEEVELNISGYEDVEVDIKPGVKTKVELFSGNNYYEYEACDGQVFSGELWVTKNGRTQLVLHSCEWHLDPVRNYGQPNPVKFRIVNHASFPIILTLIGPENYLVTVDPGINVYTVISGSYKYSYYQDNQLVTGSMMVTKNGLGTLVVTPSYVLGFIDEAEDLE
jgi:hypothetical protein